MKENYIKKILGTSVLSVFVLTLALTGTSFDLLGTNVAHAATAGYGNDDDKKEEVKVSSWKSSTKADDECIQTLKLEIKGKNFDKDAEVEIGSEKADSVNRISSKRISAKFCLSELLDAESKLVRSVGVINPDEDKVRANKKIDLGDFLAEIEDQEEEENDRRAEQERAREERQAEEERAAGERQLEQERAEQEKSLREEKKAEEKATNLEEKNDSEKNGNGELAGASLASKNIFERVFSWFVSLFR